MRLEYKGIKSCKLFTSVYETQTDCPLGCVGFGDCIKICPQNAIVLKNNTAIVTSNCCGCGKCVESCPKNLIKLFDKNIIKNNEKITLRASLPVFIFAPVLAGEPAGTLCVCVDDVCVMNVPLYWRYSVLEEP